MGVEIDLRCQDVRAMIASLPDGCAAFCYSDPPWLYEHGGNQGGVDLPGNVLDDA